MKERVVAEGWWSLSSPVVTSYRFTVVTIGLSLIVFAVLRLVTERRTDGRNCGLAKRRHYALLCIGCQKPPENRLVRRRKSAAHRVRGDPYIFDTIAKLIFGTHVYFWNV